MGTVKYQDAIISLELKTHSATGGQDWPQKVLTTSTDILILGVSTRFHSLPLPDILHIPTYVRCSILLFPTRHSTILWSEVLVSHCESFPTSEVLFSGVCYNLMRSTSLMIWARPAVTRCICYLGWLIRPVICSYPRVTDLTIKEFSWIRQKTGHLNWSSDTYSEPVTGIPNLTIHSVQRPGKNAWRANSMTYNGNFKLTYQRSKSPLPCLALDWNFSNHHTL